MSLKYRKGQGPQVHQSGIPASTTRGYDPSLRLQGDTIPFIGDSTFCFLEALVTVHDARADQRGALLSKLEGMLKKVDETLVTRQQKLLGKLEEDPFATSQGNFILAPQNGQESHFQALPLL